jgi:hypothetical protein
MVRNFINTPTIKLNWAGWKNWGLFYGYVFNETYTTLNSKGYFCIELGPLHFYYYPKV